MAELTAILVRRGTELAAMGIGVAIRADQFPYLVCRVLPARLMTGLAFQLQMFTLQPKRALLVGFAGEEGRLELFFVMAGVTV